MAGVAAPFLKFLSGMYPSELQEQPVQRLLSDAMKPASAAIVDPDRIPSPLIEASRKLVG